MVTSENSATTARRADVGRVDRLRVLESHNSTWMFDETDRMFCRVTRGDDGPMDWRPYDRLVIQPDSDAFLIFLDAAGTRLLRARRHVEPCNQCDVTQEFSLEDLAALTHPS